MSEEETTTQQSTEAAYIDNDGLDRKTLFVRSIPFDATSEELSEFFSQFVPVKHAVIVNDDDQKSRGFGFVSFTMDDDTLTALVESRNKKFKGRLLRVDIAKRRDRKEKDKSEPHTKKEVESSPVEKRRARLIIRNLPWSCKKPETLKKMFSKYGAVFDAYIPKKKGGQMCGFAFVTMKKQAAADRAVKESVGLKIDGREVAVDLAVEKSKWETIKENEPEESEEEEEEEQEEDEEESNDEEKEDEDDNDEDKEEHEDFHNLNEIKSDDEPESDVEEEAEEEEEEEAPRKKSNRQEPFAIFVRNIPYDADEDSLNEHFTTHFGPVKYALPVIDKQTGLAKGSAFAAFVDQEAYTKCIENAPTTASTSMLIPDDVSPGYVYQGRILSIASAVDRNSATRLAERNSEKRKEVLGKAPSEKDKRNLFLLNEGRITANSKLAQFISKTDLELREKSYKLRVQQLNKNPTLHLSLTRLAIRNLPRAMNSKALKALGRKAVVSFATEVREEKRQTLSKEEVNRSIKFKHDLEGDTKEDEDKKKKNKHMGVVRQAKVIMEVKGTGEIGRSRGYGFIEFRDHKAALMALRWLNAHEVSISEILEGLTEEEQKVAQLEGLAKRRLIAEFAIENAQVVKRRREKVMLARKHGNEGGDNSNNNRKRKRDDDNDQPDKSGKDKFTKKRKGPSRKGNMNKGPKPIVEKPEPKKSGLSDDVKKIIGMKRMRRKGKK
ncbi:Nucleolar protein 4 [Spathaspora sp. JA1]|nr:Nucleolar protein 4 [Spathaspora sp. JA1]